MPAKTRGSTSPVELGVVDRELRQQALITAQDVPANTSVYVLSSDKTRADSRTVARLAGAASKAKPVWQGADHPVARIEAAPLFYRICAKGLGASMWFFVCCSSNAVGRLG